MLGVEDAQVEARRTGSRRLACGRLAQRGLPTLAACKFHHCAREIRARLESQFDDAVGQWVALLAELRPEIRTLLPEGPRRREGFAALCRWEWLDRLRRDGVEAVRVAMRTEIVALARRADGSL